ncbi:MAG TPA: ankyrin repeat domain-containing protein [Steroidobacteraceae bacterium]|jgi:hypothetical protein
MSERDLDRLYRRTSAADPARPSAAARRAILDQARQLAAQAQQKKHAVAAREGRWRRLLQSVRWQIAAPVAAALLAGILLAPQWRSSLPAPARQIVTDNAPGASKPVQVAPTAANVERPPALAMPQAVPAPAAAPPPPAALSNAASETARSADLTQNENRAEAALAPAPRSPPAKRSQSAGGSINARDADGRTALMLAVMHARLSLVRELLARGADPNIADARGRTPLAVARTQNQRQLIDVLVAAGAR